MWLKYIFIANILIFLGACTNPVDPPEPYGPLPDKNQLRWHKMEYYSLVCYGLNTYTEQEWGYGDVNPSVFNPSNLNTDQWARVASKAGMKGLILVAKHHDGFCLWPSKYTDYSVESTPWKNGKGDVLGDLAKSCEKYGLKLGVYLSPWDRHHGEYGRSEYVQYYYNQLEELMTQYGDIFEFWIDGANGGTGYYGGADERRNIDRKTYYGYDSIFSIVNEHQPKAVIFSDVGPGCRWVGNEAGKAGKTNWNTITTNEKVPGVSDAEYRKKLSRGDPNGKKWIPAEANTTLLWPKAWYYHSNRQPRTLTNLMDLYYNSIGRGSTLNLGLAIAPSGQIRQEDKQALFKFRKRREKVFDENLAHDAGLSANNFRGRDLKYGPSNCLDGDIETYWATSDSIQHATLQFDFEKPTTFNRLWLQEYIALGQRIHDFVLEIEKNGKYKEVVAGTTIGYKRVLRFDEVKTSNARLTLKTRAPCLTLSKLGIYHAPRLIPDPGAHFNLKGNLTFDTTKNTDVFYALGEQPPESDFKKFRGPVKLPFGGNVYSYARDRKTGKKSEVIKDIFGVARNQWKVVGQEGQMEKEVFKAIDNNPESFYKIDSTSSGHPHDLAIDLGKSISIEGFSYLPRQDGKKEGIIYEYAFYLSKDGEKWGDPVKAGTFDNVENSPVRQLIDFKKEHKGRYFKMVSKSDVRKSGSASCAEIEVFGSK